MNRRGFLFSLLAAPFTLLVRDPKPVPKLPKAFPALGALPRYMMDGDIIRPHIFALGYRVEISGKEYTVTDISTP